MELQGKNQINFKHQTLMKLKNLILDPFLAQKPQNKIFLKKII